MVSRSAYAERLKNYPDLVFSDGMERGQRGRWHEHFRHRLGAAYDGRVLLEIGCADGGLLTDIARTRASTAFVGLDWKARPLHQAAERSAELRNIAFVRARAQELSSIVAPGELDAIWIFHPEPFAGTADLHQRLLRESFLLSAHETLRPGATLVLKTDHPGYYQWVLAILGLPEPEAFPAARAGHSPVKVKSHELVPPAQLPPASTAVRERFALVARSADFWNDPAAQAAAQSHPFAGRSTQYESRFLKKRLPIYYLELRAHCPDRSSPPTSP